MLLCFSWPPAPPPPVCRCPLCTRTVSYLCSVLHTPIVTVSYLLYVSYPRFLFPFAAAVGGWLTGVARVDGVRVPVGRGGEGHDRGRVGRFSGQVLRGLRARELDGGFPFGRPELPGHPPPLPGRQPGMVWLGTVWYGMVWYGAVFVSVARRDVCPERTLNDR